MLSVPVKPSVVIYSQFNHVRGIAAGAGQNGVPLNRVRILNTLIDKLVSMKTKNKLIAKEDAEKLSDPQKDALIKQYQQEVKNMVAQYQQSPIGTYGLAGVMPEPGTVFSVQA